MKGNRWVMAYYGDSIEMDGQLFTVTTITLGEEPYPLSSNRVVGNQPSADDNMENGVWAI